MPPCCCGSPRPDRLHEWSCPLLTGSRQPLRPVGTPQTALGWPSQLTTRCQNEAFMEQVIAVRKPLSRALRPGRRQHLGASSGWLPLTRARLVAVTTTSSSCFSTSAMEYYKLPHYGRLRFEVHAGRSLRRRHDVPHSAVIVRRSMLHVSRQKSLKDMQQVNVDDKSSIRHVLLQLKCWYVLDYGS